MEKTRPTRLVAPDGGFGWVATLGVSMVNVSISEVFVKFYDKFFARFR